MLITFLLVNLNHKLTNIPLQLKKKKSERYEHTITSSNKDYLKGALQNHKYCQHELNKNYVNYIPCYKLNSISVKCLNSTESSFDNFF